MSGLTKAFGRAVQALTALAATLVWSAAARAAEPPPVEAYGKLPGVEQISLSPSGDRFAFIAVVDEKRQLVVTTVDGMQVMLAEPVGKAKVTRIIWAGEDHLLVEVSQTVPLSMFSSIPKVEWGSFEVYNVRTRVTFNVFEHQRLWPIASGYYGVTQLDGHWYGYFGGIPTDQGVRHLYRVDLDTDELSIADAGQWFTDNWLVAPDGSIVAHTDLDGDTGWRLMAGGGHGRMLTSGRNDIWIVGTPLRGRSPDSVLIKTPVDDHFEWREQPLAGGPPRQILNDDLVHDILSDPISGLWIGYVRDQDDLAPVMFSPDAQARVDAARKALGGSSASLVSYTSDMNRMIFETSGTDDPGTYWLVDIPARRAKPVGYERPQIPGAAVGPIEMVDWKASDGLALRGVLNLPPDRPAKDLPVIVMPHGGPEDRDYPGFWWWAQMFASRGYAVFQPNFRGSSGYGVAFRNAGFGQFGRKMQTDISDGLESLVQRGIVDPKRACIVGWSYGGYAALAGVTVQQGLYRCSVSMAGVSDLAGLMKYAAAEGGPYGGDLRYWRLYTGGRGVWDTELTPYSPIKQAARADAPILLIHGKDDSVVPISQSQDMARALTAAGKPVEFVTLDGADHWLLREDTRLAMAKASLDFVLKYDPPDPPPAQPVKAASAQ